VHGYRSGFTQDKKQKVSIMKILILGTSKFGGGKGRINAYYKFLKSRNHDIDLITIPGNEFFPRAWYYFHSAIHLTFEDFPYLVKKIGDRLEKVINKEKYDVVIAVETLFSYALTKDIGCLKIFSCESLEADERYYQDKNELEEIHKIREIECEIFDSSDYIIFPWETTEEYVKKHIYDSKKLMTIKYGCYPTAKNPSYFYPVSIISMGSLRQYWSNKRLLSDLTEISPYIIDVYGKHKPENEYNINYKGFAKSQDIIYNYQFGLNTVSKDNFRKNHFSSRIINYLGYGLPVLFPDWQEFPKKLDGCISYNENNFIEKIEKYSDKNEWEKMCLKAKTQGIELNWDNTLIPLETLIEKG